MDPVTDARALVAERFPAALAAFLGDGIVSERRTPTSDLDIVVILAGPPAPYRESLRWRGWPAETFVHDAESLEEYFARDTRPRRPSLARLCADSVVLAGSQETIDQVRKRAREVLAIGPPVPGRAELELRRYGLTDLLDDLAGSSDPAESAVIAWNIWEQTAELALVLAGRWLGSGKWLVRELRVADAVLATAMTEAFTDQPALTGIAREVLARAGGPLWDGYRVPGNRD